MYATFVPEDNLQATCPCKRHLQMPVVRHACFGLSSGMDDCCEALHASSKRHRNDMLLGPELRVDRPDGALLMSARAPTPFTVGQHRWRWNPSEVIALQSALSEYNEPRSPTDATYPRLLLTDGLTP